jgi:iron complex outermembrane recepter protein
MYQGNRRTGIAAVVSAVLGVAAAAQAALPSDSLEEVVVTAQKRSENLQSVPLSITSFSSLQLEQKSIASFADYGTRVPNLAFAPTGDGIGTSRSISIRGISGNDTTGFYVDDTPLPDSIDPRILDVDHIEVLRGPQGTLYGARSMGGTVRIITKKVDLSEFSATVHGGASKTDRTNRGNWTADATVNIPLIKDQVALRLTGFYDQQAGYFKRSFCTDPATTDPTLANPCRPLSTTGITTLNNIGALDTYGGAASLTIKLGDNLTITPRLMTQRASYNGFPLADVVTTPGNGFGYPVPVDAYALPKLVPRNFTQARSFNVAEGGSDSWDLASLAIKWKTDLGEFVSSTAYFGRRVFETEDETDFIWSVVTSGAGGAPQPGPISELKNYQRFVQEVRFASDLKGPMQFVVGAFYSDLHGRIPFAAYYPPATVPGLDNTLGGPGFQFSPDYKDLVFWQDFRTKVKEPSVFGELYYNLTDALKLTVGARWYQVKTSSAGFEEGLATNNPELTPSPEVTKTESGVNPKVQLDYHVTADHMVYATAAKGFRPGGVVPAVPAGLGCELPPGTNLADTRSYKSDSLWNYELGAKTAWLDHRLTVNASVFDIRWKNIQQPVLLACGFQYIANGGAAESKGGEAELHFRATAALDLSLGIGYQDAKITEKGTSPQLPGSPVYQVPDVTANGGVTYTTAIGHDMDLVWGVDYAYIGRSFSGNNDPANPRERPSYGLLNGRIALTRGSTEYALVGKNLSNEAANLGDSRSIAAETPGRPRLLVNQPRTVGLEFRTHF